MNSLVLTFLPLLEAPPKLSFWNCQPAAAALHCVQLFPHHQIFYLSRLFNSGNQTKVQGAIFS
jgi:hypothetical protein